MLGLRGRGDLCGPKDLGKESLERAIGVIYRPETEIASHYFRANLPQQIDEYVWIDDTRAVTLSTLPKLTDFRTHPFGV